MDIFLSHFFINFASQVTDIYIYNIRFPCISISPNLFKNFFTFQDTIFIFCQE